MKIYFLVIIIVLVVVIFLLFYLIYKIYILHVKSYEDGEFDEEEAPLSQADEVDAGPLSETVQSSQESLSTKTGSSSVTEESTASVVQPHVKSMLGPILSVAEDLKSKNGVKEKCSFTVLFEYISEEMKLVVTLLEASNLPKVKSGSSEAYTDMQVSPYKHRTYRPPGYRRPLRGCLKRPVDFSLEQSDVNVHFFILFLLRYDPFSRLAVDGEIKIPLNELKNLLDGEQVTVTLELTESKQQFTGFIFRHGSGSTRSLNGARSTNSSPSGIRRSFDDSSRSSSRSFNGFSRALDESTFKRHGTSSDHHNGSSNGHSDHTLTAEEKIRASSRSFSGVRTKFDDSDESNTLGLKRHRSEKRHRKRKGAIAYSPLARKDEFNK